MPGTPAIVKSCVDCSRRTRSNVDSSRSRSRSRPTSARRGAAHVDADARLRLGDLPHRHRLGLAFRLDGRVVAVVDHVPRRAERRFADEDAVRRRRALQARRGVHDIACDHPFSELWTRIDADERVPRVHRHAHLELAVLGDPVANCQRRANRALGVVFVRDRRAEHRHHGVADELLHRAAAVLELCAQPLVVRAQDRLDVLRVERFRARREADEIGEQHRHNLALAAHQRTRSVG